MAKSVDAKEDEAPNGNSGPALTTLCNVNSSSNLASTNGQSHGYSPITAKGHKDSVYALAMSDTGNTLVSGGTEKVLCSSSLRMSMQVSLGLGGTIMCEFLWTAFERPLL